MKHYFALLTLFAMLTGVGVTSYYFSFFLPYPPAIVAVTAALVYVVLAFIEWPLDMFVFSKTLRKQSDELASESIQLSGTLCAKIKSMEQCRNRHVHWGELVESRHAAALMSLYGFYTVTDRLLRTAKSAWKAGVVLSIFVVLVTGTVYLDGSHDRIWPGSYKETMITAGVAFFVLGAVVLALVWQRLRNKETFRAAVEVLSHSQTLVPITPMTSPDQTLTFFRDATPALLQWVKKYAKSDDQSTLISTAIDKLKVNLAVMETEIATSFSSKTYFDHHVNERRLSFNERYLGAWERHAQWRKLNHVQRLTVFYHFMLHEFFHLDQNISSYRYHFTDYAMRPLLNVDYRADALSTLALYELYTQFHPPGWVPDPQWNLSLAELIRLAIVDLEVFTAFEHPYPQGSMSWFSFHRYLQWHFQYARARQYQVKTPSLESFDLLSTPDIVLGGVDDQGGSYQANMAFTKPQLVVVGRDAKLYEFNGETPSFTSLLADAVLRGNLEDSNRLFADLFGTHPSLIGK